jgi:hypothetical protein
LLTWWVKVRPLVKDGFPEEFDIHEALAWSGFRVDELNDLCKDSSVFGDETLFLIVHGLIGKMTVFQDLLKVNVQRALNHWKERTAGEFRRVSARLAHEIDRLLKEARR